MTYTLSSNNMTSLKMLCVVGLLLLIISKSVLAYDGIQMKDVSHGNLVTTDNLTKEPNLQQWNVQPVSPPGCPEPCSCKKNDAHHIVNVDCSSRNLTTVPELPQTTAVLSLENNSISNITCDSFKHPPSLQDLSLASNNISHLPSCLFQSQSGSLLHLNISDNDINYLDVKLFQDLSQLKTLDLSVNAIIYLANRTFSDLTQLIHLNLSFNFIDGVEPDAFKGLRSLKTLSLRNNWLDNDTSFHRDVFQDLVALEILDVKANKGHLENAISSLRNLSHLYMDLSYMSEVPALGTGYRQLTNLQVLHATGIEFMRGGRYKERSECYKRTVPSNFFDNIRTEKSLELYMSGCSIDNIENYVFHALPTLVTLDLSDDKLSFGTKSQGWMASLINTTITSLDLSSTSQFLSSQHLFYLSFEDLDKTNLKTLSLRRNKIYSIGRFQHFPTTIEKLDVSENAMPLNLLYYTFLHSNISDIKLRELYANDQQALMATKQISQEIPDANIFGHTKKAVGAGGTSVHSELSETDRMDGLKVLNIFQHEMDDLHHVGKDEKNFWNVRNANSKFSFTKRDPNFINVSLTAHLEAIHARSALLYNRIYVPHIRILNNTVLRHVDVSENVLTSWVGPVENVPSLTFLDLSRNYCDNVDVNFFTSMASLEILILRENYLGSVLVTDVDGHIFSALTNLKVLDMSQNIIQDLSRLAFVNNTNLQTLDLSHNELTDFQPTLTTIRNMSLLDLSDNLLPGLSEQTCQELKLLNSRNKMFTINLLDNRLLFTCDYLPFLDLVFSNPHIFYRVEDLKFRCINETTFFYKDLAHHFPTLSRECLIQSYFDIILIAFFLHVGTVTIFAVIYYKRWKLRYLYYIGHRRMHIGEHAVNYEPAADIFVTYDQDDLRWRRFMQQTFLPGLTQRNITYKLGETDFPGGDLMAHISGAVVGTRKTVVLFSMDIFNDWHRQFEVNLAIMREMKTRSLKIVPIFAEEVDLNLASYPREIKTFLRHQRERCLTYEDSDAFWDAFVDAVREDS